MSDSRNIQQILADAQNKYNDAVQALESKQAELDGTVKKFYKFWRKTLKENIVRFCEYMSDAGIYVSEKEYSFNVDDVNHPPIMIDEFKEQNVELFDYSGMINAISQDFGQEFVQDVGNIITAQDGESRKDAVVNAAANIAVSVGLAGLTLGLAKVNSLLNEWQNKDRALEYELRIDEAVAKMESSYTQLEGWIRTVNELWTGISECAGLTKKALDKLEPLIPDFRKNDEYCVSTLELTKPLIVALGKLSQTPLIDETGKITSEYKNISKQIRTITNRR